jgi:ribosomal protein L40E
MIMTVSENICPVCKTANQLEATVCRQCGATLGNPLIDTGLRTKTTDMQAVTPEMIREWSLQVEKEVAVPDGGIAFYVDGHSMPAYIDPDGDFVLGRAVGTSSEQLLDLAPFGGYSLGLSRRHAVIRRIQDGYELLDLGSVNGTWLEEERLVPHRSYPLPSGSHLRLGRMRLLVLYRSVGETK